MVDINAINRVLDEVQKELQRAYAKFPVGQKSNHEGYAVLLEELDEVWDEVKRDNSAGARKEAIQVAAMAVRFIVDQDARENGYSKSSRLADTGTSGLS